MNSRKVVSIIAVAAMVIVSFGALSSDANGCQSSSDLHKEPVEVSDLLDFAFSPEVAVKDMGGKGNGVSWDGSTNTLCLNNTAISLCVKESYSTTGCCMILPDNAKIKLTGDNTIEFKFNTYPARYLVFNERPLDLTLEGTGSLTLSTHEASQGTVNMVFGNISTLVINGCGLYYERTYYSSITHFTDAETVLVFNGADISIKGPFAQSIFTEKTKHLYVFDSSVFLRNESRVFDYSKEDRVVLYNGSTLKVSKDVTDDPQDDFDIANIEKYQTMKFVAESGPESVPPGIMATIALAITAIGCISISGYRKI